MPRPIKPRRIELIPRVTYYKPSGVPMKTLEEVVLTLDELEALRLKDMEGLEQHDCADRMGVAQSTLQRILVTARRKLVQAIVEGKALRVQGGVYSLVQKVTCRRCRHRWGQSNDVKNCPSCGSKDITKT